MEILWPLGLVFVCAVIIWLVLRVERSGRLAIVNKLLTDRNAMIKTIQEKEDEITRHKLSELDKTRNPGGSADYWSGLLPVDKVEPKDLP